MSVMELKGNFHQMIAQIDDQNLLRKMFEQCLDLAKMTDSLDDMPAEAITELEQAVQASYHDETGVAHEDVRKLFKTWVGQ